MPDFQLDARLARDTLPAGRLGACRALLMNDSRWPWMILVPERTGATELFDLSAAERAALVECGAVLGAALKAATGAEKINVAAIGNLVRQLHLHVVARASGDPNWPGPVWGFGTTVPYAAGEAETLLARVGAHVALA